MNYWKQTTCIIFAISFLVLGKADSVIGKSKYGDIAVRQAADTCQVYIKESNLSRAIVSVSSCDLTSSDFEIASKIGDVKFPMEVSCGYEVILLQSFKGGNVCDGYIYWISIVYQDSVQTFTFGDEDCISIDQAYLYDNGSDCYVTLIDSSTTVSEGTQFTFTGTQSKIIKIDRKERHVISDKDTTIFGAFYSGAHYSGYAPVIRFSGAEFVIDDHDSFNTTSISEGQIVSANVHIIRWDDGNLSIRYLSSNDKGIPATTSETTHSIEAKAEDKPHDERQLHSPAPLQADRSATLLRYAIILAFVLLLALAVKPIRKAVGLLLVILGILASLSVWLLILGVPMILVGAILLFI